MNSPSLLLQILGRAPARRFVHAQRARTLRKAGKAVFFHHNSTTGRAVYVWVPKRGPENVDFVVHGGPIKHEPEQIHVKAWTL